MKKLSLLVKSLAICLVIVFFTNSIGYAIEPTIPNAQTECGEWKIESADSNKDQRIGITLLRQATGNECYGMFTLKNQTGTLLGGGYSLALKASSKNANIQYLPYGDPILIPGLDIEIKTLPIDITKQANINLQGEVTLGSFLAVDMSFFAMKSILELIPLPTGCLVSYDQLLLISLRTAPVLENAARLAFQGDLIGSKEEFSRSLNVFYEKAGEAAKDIGIGCLADFLDEVVEIIIKKPIVGAKIILSYITWVPVVIFDYFKYQGFLTSVRLSYIPSIPPLLTPLPTPLTITPPTTIIAPVTPVISSNSSTAMLFDVSSSMNEQDVTSISKLDAAKNSGARILDIIQAEKAVFQGAEVGILSFATTAQVYSNLSADVNLARSALYSLSAYGRTGMPDGLRLAIDEFPNMQSSKPIIILLSDGLPNVGLRGTNVSDPAIVRQQVLDLASEAGSKGICIYTVGFGVPSTGSGNFIGGSIDENLLKQVAANSGCGAYYNAQNAIELANVYVRLRHESTGNILLKQTGNISRGQTVDIGNVQVPDNQSMILFTLNWPGSRLDAVLTDPSGQTVDTNYPKASFSISDTLASIIIQDPQTGEWNVVAKGVDVPEDTTVYNAIMSVRPNPNPPTPMPQATPQASIPPTPGFPIVILILVVAGGGIAIYVYTSTRAKRRFNTPIGVLSAQLICISGEKAGQTVSIKDRLLIGRGSGCRIRLSDRTVSRQHATLRFANGHWFIQDMNSRTGTFVNDAKIEATTLNAGDRIRIGSSIFEFRITR